MIDFNRIALLRDRFNYSARRLLDIGANAGGFTADFLKIFPEAVPTLVEANPYCYPALERIGHELVKIAVSDSDSERDFFTSRVFPETTGGSFYVENNEMTKDTLYSESNLLVERVRTARLDSLFPDRTFDFIKMDIQGSEADAILGGRDLVSRADFVLLECAIMEYNLGSPDVEVVVRLMRELNFDLHDVLDFHRHPDIFQGRVTHMDILFKSPRVTQQALI